MRRTVFAVAGGALALLLAACGSSGTNSAAPASQAPASSAARAGGPAASGTVAAVAASSIEVQSTSSGQVTVNFSNTTTFTDRATAALADVTTGSCVSVTGTGTPITAQSVDITAANGNNCTFGGQGGGMRPQQGGSSRPSRPSGSSRPSGAANGGGGRAFGKVTAVSGTGFTVQQDNQRTGATTDVQVTVNSTTTYFKNESSNSAALKVGECVSAQGKADDTGAVTAQSIAISQASANGCDTGFGGGRQRNGGGNG
ncbi:DUF5666 domain-containing protein [Amycolatopsis sp.]|uniref:DUF5666 domain-containing protein n=1 Tax=Amycolatopsis sp. TaxID=37632 RepID=UPI002C65BAB5|nr:DUF5666 domain-containing protein [Amycolatopsis sp.]HVV14165.1 DUF5666 domain-containing protein [Amycolatopsis sp.]